MQDNLLQGLNPEQRRAVECVEGPLLILAGAGSGKTKTLTHRIAYLIAMRKATPYSILAVTFTNKAAREMRERVYKLMNGGDAQDIPRSFMPYMGTFHGICVRMLRQDGDHAGVPTNFVIFDESDRLSAIKRACKAARIDEKQFTPRTILTLISSAKNEMMGPQEFQQSGSGPLHQAAAQVFPLYQAELKQASALDFDDLIGRTVHMLQAHPEVRRKWQQQFTHIMIDEYQDTNAAQYKLVKLLTDDRHSIAVVGDDWQCLPPGSMVQTVDGQKPIEAVAVGDHVTAAAGYNRVNEARITGVKQLPYKGDLICITTASGKVLRCTPKHLLFGRFQEMTDYYVYLMFVAGMGYRIGMAKGTRFDGRQNTIGLRVRSEQERADRMWVLKTCKTRAEAQYFEALYSYSYGIPMMVFRAYLNRSMNITQERIDELYRNIDTAARAEKLMTDLHISFDYPHLLPQATIRGDTKRLNVSLVLFGDRRASQQSPWCASRISANTSDQASLAGFKDAGYNVRSANAGTYRVELHNLDYGKLEQIIGAVVTKANIGRYAFITDNKYTFLPSGQLHLGMLVPTLQDGVLTDDEIVNIEYEAYDGPVYDLDVDKVHNYIANGVAVHNSIYSWRGADFRNILNFERDYPEATVIKLEQNYRSTKAILDAAHAVITRNQQRSDKKLWTDSDGGKPIGIIQVANERAEAEAIVRRVQNAVQARFRRYNDFAVLYRTNAQSRSLEEVFIRYGIPYRIVGGQRFYDRKEIKDLVAYLRLLYQSEDIASFERIVNVPARGIGAKSLESFYAWRRVANLGLQAAMESVQGHPSLTPRAKKGLLELADIMRTARESMQELMLPIMVESLIKRIGYYQYLDDKTAQGETRQENVREFVGVTKAYQELGLDGFLEEVALVSDVDTADYSSDAVTLMTLHAAKGLEFPVVFMTGLEETVFPHSRALYDQSEMEEERRLCYVGMTRAKEELYVCYATSRMLYGGMQHNPPSRFLREIDGQFQVDSVSLGGSAWQNSYDQYADEQPAAVVSDEPRYIPELSEGDTVSHGVFGQGTVVEINGDDVVVYFKTKGAKRLNLAFAPLQKL